MRVKEDRQKIIQGYMADAKDGTSVQEKKAFILYMKQGGDIVDACRQLGCTDTIFHKAMNRNDDRYTVAEMNIILVMYGMMKERQRLKEVVGI